MRFVPQLKKRLEELEVEEEYLMENANTLLPICTMEAFGLEILPESYQITNKVDYIEDEGGFDEDEYIMKEDVKNVVLNYLSRKDDFSGLCILLSHGFIDGQIRSPETIALILNTTKDKVVSAEKQWIKEAQDDLVKGDSPLADYSITLQNLGVKYNGNYNRKPLYNSYEEFVMSYVDYIRELSNRTLSKSEFSEIDRDCALETLTSADILEEMIYCAKIGTFLSDEGIQERRNPNINLAKMRTKQ